MPFPVIYTGQVADESISEPKLTPELRAKLGQSSPLTAAFDTTQSAFVLGVLPADARLIYTEITIDTPFDTGVLSVGSLLEQGCCVASFVLGAVGVWQISESFRAVSSTDLFLFVDGSPTQGAGSIVLFWQ